MNPVEKALAAAKAANTELAAAAPQASTAVQAYLAGQRFTTDDLSGSGHSIDAFVSIDKNGLMMKGKDGLIESIVVAIDTIKGIQIFEGVRFGDPVQYMKTYDGVRCETGGSWAAALQRAQAADPKCRPYQGGDLAMEVIEEAKNVKGAVVAEAGTTLGLSTSVTARDNLKSFINAYKEAGLDGKTVLVRLGYEPRTNARGAWGLPTFELLGEYNPEQA